MTITSPPCTAAPDTVFAPSRLKWTTSPPATGCTSPSLGCIVVGASGVVRLLLLLLLAVAAVAAVAGVAVVALLSFVRVPVLCAFL